MPTEAAAKPAKEKKPKAPAKAKGAKAAPEQESQPTPSAPKEAAQPAPQPEAAKPDSKSVKPLVGNQNFDLESVPNDFKELAAVKFGTQGEKMKHSVARANGSYRGAVLVSDDYMAQEVAKNSVVYHRRDDIEYKNQKLEWRNKEGKLNGQNIQLHYSGSNAKAYPHDPEKGKDEPAQSSGAAGAAQPKIEAFKRMVEAQKETAKSLNFAGVDQFVKNLDAVTAKMLEQVNQKAPQQQQRQQAPDAQR